jgi:hypothetical protein
MLDCYQLIKIVFLSFPPLLLVGIIFSEIYWKKQKDQAEKDGFEWRFC